MKLKAKLDIDYGYYFEKGRSQSEPEEDQKENHPVSWLEPVKLPVIGGSTSSSILSDSAFDELSQELFLNQGLTDRTIDNGLGLKGAEDTGFFGRGWL